MRPEYAKPGRVGSILTPHFVRKMVAVSGELLGENSGIFWGVKIDPTFGGPKNATPLPFFRRKRMGPGPGGIFQNPEQARKRKKTTGGRKSAQRDWGGNRCNPRSPASGVYNPCKPYIGVAPILGGSILTPQIQFRGAKMTPHWRSK